MSKQAEKRLAKGQAVKKPAVTPRSIFHGRRCFICNESLKGNTCQLSKTCTQYTRTPFTRCLNEVMGSSYEVLITKNDKSCQKCAALIQQRDKLHQEMMAVNKALHTYLTRKYTLLNVANRHGTTVSPQQQPIRMVAPVTQVVIEDQTSSGLKVTKQTLHGTVTLPAPQQQQQRQQQRKKKKMTIPVIPSDEKTSMNPVTKSMQLYQCTKCLISSTNPAQLKNHTCNKEPNVAVADDFTERDDAVKHIGVIKIVNPMRANEKSLEKFVCRYCELEFTDKSEFINHSREHLSSATEFLECTLCSEIFALKEEFDEHQKTHYESIKCTACLETFTNMETFTTHLTPTLKINTNHCSSCNTSFASKDDFNMHAATVHPNVPVDNNDDPLLVMKLTYVCTCCQSELEDFKEFVRHKEEHVTDSIANVKLDTQLTPQEVVEDTEHTYAMEENLEAYTSDESKVTNVSGVKKPVYECGMCPIRAESVEKLMEHFKTHKSSKIICKHCHIILPSVNELSKHLQYHMLPGQAVECQLCTPTITLKSKDMLMKHMADLHKQKHQCPYCGEQFRFLRELVIHRNQHPESKKYICLKCSMRFQHLHQLQKHVDLNHRDPKCRVCSKIIRHPVKLRQHEARHRNEKFACTKCERIFKTPSGLRNHQAVHTGEYKYRCDTCERGFMNRNIFIEHTNNHLEKPKPLYKCDVCNKNFFYQGSLWIHRKWHKNPYPYECKLCGKKLRHASVLQVHLRKHRGERPYKCPYCPMTFNSPSTFKRHLMLHTGEYSHRCEDCNKGFTGKNKYQLHRHSIHGDPLPKRRIMTEMDYKVNVPVHPLANMPCTSTMDMPSTAYIVENVGNAEGDNDEGSRPRVVEVVINEDQQAVSSITLMGEPAPWTDTNEPIEEN